MGKKRNNSSEGKRYECVGGKFKDINGTPRNDTFARIYESMLWSEAFQSLTKNQRLLYVYCKAQIMGKRKPKQDYKEYELYQEEECFYFCLHDAINYKLYSYGGKGSFYKDMQALEKAGFIKKVSSGQKSKSKNVYKLVSDWQYKNKNA